MSTASTAAALTIAFVAPTVLAPTAGAQTPELDPARVAQLELELQNTRLRALNAERQAAAVRLQLETEQRLRAAGAVQAPSPGAALLASSPPLPQGAPTPVASIDSQMAADAERIMQLQDQALARSNARILAAQPAL